MKGWNKKNYMGCRKRIRGGGRICPCCNVGTLL